MRKNHLESGTIKLALDGAGYHRSDIVKDEAKILNIDLIYLPPYSMVLIIGMGEITEHTEQVFQLFNNFIVKPELAKAG